MKITLAQAVALFTALEFEGADNWTADRFNQKFAKLGVILQKDPTKAPAATDIADKTIRAQFTKIVKTLSLGDTVVVEDAEAPEAEAPEADAW